MYRQDMTGQVFSRLTVLSRIENEIEWGFWKCQCECGKIVTKNGRLLRAGKTRSCGCLRVEKSIERFTKHGMEGTPEYRAWQGMWERCSNPNAKNYNEYKTRTPPEEWRSFEVFFKELGLRPSDNHSLDRIRNEEPYGPGNCRWATKEEQARNRSSNRVLEAEGRSLILSEWAEELEVDRKALTAYLKTHSIEEAIQFYRAK